MEQRHEIIRALSKILQFLNDSAASFKNHAHNVNKYELSKLFENCYLSRKEMMMEIRGELDKLGIKATVKGTLLGKAHMLFENIKSYWKGGDAFAITKEVRRGESDLIDYYRHALSLQLPVSVRLLLIKHLSKIEDDIKKSDLMSVQ